MWYMVFIAADCAITALLFMYSSIISNREGWQSVDYLAVLLPFFLSSILFSAVIWPRGWIPKNTGPFTVGAVNVACYAGIGVILTFADSPVAWGVSLGVAGLFRPYNTAFIAYFGFNDQSASLFAVLCRLRTLFEDIGFAIAALAAFHAFHFIDDGNLITTIALSAAFIVVLPMAYQSANDQRFGFYRPAEKRIELDSSEARTALRSVLAQSFIVEFVRYSLISYGFIVLLTRVQYVPALLPVALCINAIIGFFGSTVLVHDRKQRAVSLAIAACLLSYVLQLIVDFSGGVDSSYLFIPYVVAAAGLSLINHVPMTRLHSVVTAAKITNTSFVSLELTAIHLGAALGCLLTVAIHKWFACPLYALYVALLLYMQLNEKRIEDEIRGLDVLNSSDR
jgi:hypothetical protein